MLPLMLLLRGAASDAAIGGVLPLMLLLEAAASQVSPNPAPAGRDTARAAPRPTQHLTMESGEGAMTAAAVGRESCLPAAAGALTGKGYSASHLPVSCRCPLPQGPPGTRRQHLSAVCGVPASCPWRRG